MKKAPRKRLRREHVGRIRKVEQATTHLTSAREGHFSDLKGVYRFFVTSLEPGVPRGSENSLMAKGPAPSPVGK